MALLKLAVGSKTELVKREEENMAANCARRTITLSSASTTAILSRTSSSSSSSTSFTSAAAAKLKGLGSAKPTSSSRLSFHKLKLSRLPAELGGAQSLMPLHSVTASALFTSLLSLNQGSWGCLSEGFAATL